MWIFRFLYLIVLFPLSWLDAKKHEKASFAQRFGQIQYWCRKVLQLFKVRLIVENEENISNIEGAILFVSNHQETIDPLPLVAAIPRPFSFVSKKENQKIPIISKWADNLELIYFDREDSKSAMHMLRETTRYLKRDLSVLIFPEGTRSKSKQMQAFKSGAIKPAYMAKATIVPIAQIHSYNYKKIFKKGESMTIAIGSPILYENYKEVSLDDLSLQLQQEIQQMLDQYSE